MYKAIENMEQPGSAATITATEMLKGESGGDNESKTNSDIDMKPAPRPSSSVGIAALAQ